MQDAPEGAARVGLAELERREEALERRVVREQQVQVCLECVRRPVFFFRRVELIVSILFEVFLMEGNFKRKIYLNEDEDGGVYNRKKERRDV